MSSRITRSSSGGGVSSPPSLSFSERAGVAGPLEASPVGPRCAGGSNSTLAIRFQIQDKEQVDALWERVRIEVLDPLEAALANFDPRATEVVRKKYYEVYSSVYHVVNDPNRDDLDRHPLILTKHLETLTSYLERVTLPSLAAAHDGYLLRAVGEQWGRYVVLNNWLHKLLIFVERSYLGRQPGKVGLKERGLRQFSKVVFSRSGQGRLLPLVLAIDNVVTRWRSQGEGENGGGAGGRTGPTVDADEKEACRACVELLVETGVTMELKDRLLASARKYFAGRAALWMGGLGGPEEGGREDAGRVGWYMRRVETALLHEEGLLREFDLSRALGEESLVVAVQELVQAHGESVVTREVGGCAWLLRQRRYEELGLMYRLFRREMLTVAAAQAAASAAAAVAVKEMSAQAAAAAAAALGGPSQGHDTPPSTPPSVSYRSRTSSTPHAPPPHPSFSPASPELASLSTLSLTPGPLTPADPSASASPPSLVPTHSSSSEHPLLDRMGVILEAHVISLGEALQEDRNARLAKDRRLEAHDPLYIEALLEMHAEYVELTTSVLGAHRVFKSRLHAAFVAILNDQTSKTTASSASRHLPRQARTQGSRPLRSNLSLRGQEEKPRLITSACDRLLRVGGTREEAKVKEILGLVLYLRDKDFFEGCYRTELMRRLLANRYEEGAEKSAIARLRVEHGVHYAQHSQRMLNETATSKELVHSFLHSYPPALTLRRESCVDFSVTVMAQGGWPVPAAFAQFSCRPPSVLVSYMECFSSFYLGLDIGRGKKLDWVLREGLLVVQATYPSSSGGSRRFEVSSNPHMLLPLLAFSIDESKSLSLAALQERTGMTKGNLDIVLGELRKAGFLRMETRKGGREGGGEGAATRASSAFLVPRDESSEQRAVPSSSSSSSSSSPSSSASASFSDTVYVSLIPDFRSKHKRLTILPKKMEEDKERGISEDVIKDRTLKCQAILVRVMKLKKCMAYRELVVEVVRQCQHAHFTPDVSFVRRVVEGLIDTEYLRRAEEKRDWLEYIA